MLSIRAVFFSFLILHSAESRGVCRDILSLVYDVVMVGRSPIFGDPNFRLYTGLSEKALNETVTLISHALYPIQIPARTYENIKEHFSKSRSPLSIPLTIIKKDGTRIALTLTLAMLNNSLVLTVVLDEEEEILVALEKAFQKEGPVVFACGFDNEKEKDEKLYTRCVQHYERYLKKYGSSRVHLIQLNNNPHALMEMHNISQKYGKSPLVYFETHGSRGQTRYHEEFLGPITSLSHRFLCKDSTIITDACLPALGPKGKDWMDSMQKLAGDSTLEILSPRVYSATPSTHKSLFLQSSNLLLPNFVNAVGLNAKLKDKRLSTDEKIEILLNGPIQRFRTGLSD